MNCLPAKRYDHLITDIIQLKADQHDLLCGIYENTYPLRLFRRTDERKIRKTANMMTTRIKLVTSKGVESTRKFAPEWSRKHSNQNFFSINSVHRYDTLKYPEPWCGEFQWEDDPQSQRSVLVGLQFHIASMQTIDLKNKSLDHPLFHLIIETHMHDYENRDKMQLVDCYSCDILIFYFGSSKIHELCRAFNEGFVKKSYLFDKCSILDTTFHQPCEQQFKILDENLFMDKDWVEIIQMITHIDDYEPHPKEGCLLKEQSTQGKGEKGKHRDPFIVKGPNFLFTHFLLKLIGGQVSKTVNNGQDWANVSTEPFEISIECQHINCPEILNFNFSMSINNPKYDLLNINGKIQEYAINMTDSTENKFFRFIPDRSCVGDNFLDYQQHRAQPQHCSIKYLPDESKKFKVAFQISLTDDDLISLLNDGLIDNQKSPEKTIMSRKSTKKKRNIIEESAEEEEADEPDPELDKTPQAPVKCRIMVEIASTNYGTIYERHFKDVMVYSPVDYRRNILYEQAITPNLNFDDQECIFHREEKAKHFLSQDGFVIPLIDKSTINNFFGPNENFILSLNNRNFHCKREFPNDPESFIVIHYPDFTKKITHSKRVDQAERVSFENCSTRLDLVEQQEQEPQVQELQFQEQQYQELLPPERNERRPDQARQERNKKPRTRTRSVVKNQIGQSNSSSASSDENTIKTTNGNALNNDIEMINDDEIILLNGPVVANGTNVTNSIPIIPKETVPCNGPIIAKKTVVPDFNDTSGSTITKGLTSPRNGFQLLRKAMEENAKPNDQQISNGNNIRYNSGDDSAEHSESDSEKEAPPINEDST